LFLLLLVCLQQNMSLLRHFQRRRARQHLVPLQ
jgi:hypothetical protein